MQTATRGSRRSRSTALGLEREDVATQVIPRDRHAALLAGAWRSPARRLTGSPPRCGTCSAREVREAREPFARRPEGQSAMPHKQNPIVSERISGLARVLRANAQVGFENIVALARARHLPLLGRARRAARLDHRSSTTCSTAHCGWSRGWRSTPSGCCATWGLPRAGVLRPGAAGPGRRRDAPRAAPTRSCSATRCAPGTRAARSAACWRPTPRSTAAWTPPRWTPRSTSTSFLRHVDEIFDRTPRRWGLPVPDALQALHAGSGKVRELYRFGDELLLVASDRISAFDVIMPTPIPHKGRVLTGLSLFWFDRTADLVPEPPADRGAARSCPRRTHASPTCAGRVDARPPADMLPIECVVRGYLAGSGVEGVPGDRRGLRSRAAGGAARVGPAARADLHAGDQGTSRATTSTSTVETAGIADRPTTGRPSWSACRSASTSRRPSTRAERGIIIADTKFEFGLDAAGEVVLGDEVLTPDSSRFWPAEGYAAGRARSRRSTSSTCATGWRRSTGTRRRPGRSCPTRSSRARARRYVEAYELLTGEPFAAYLQRMGVPDESDGAGAAPRRHPRPAGGGDPPLAGRARPPGSRGARGQGVRPRGRRRTSAEEARRLATEVAESVLSEPADRVSSRSRPWTV